MTDKNKQKLNNNLELLDTVSKFHAIFSSMSDGILVVKKVGVVEFVNQAFCNIFELSDTPESPINLTDFIIFYVNKYNFIHIIIYILFFVFLIHD